MAVEVVDLLAPEGPVEETLFSGEGDGTAGTDLHARLTAYISRAEAKTAGIAFPTPEDEEEAQEKWALHLTFDAAYTLAISRPANEDSKVEIIGSRGFAADQRKALWDKAQQYAQEYRGLLALLPTVTQPLGPQSRETTNTFVW